MVKKLKPWICPRQNHLSWSATSTLSSDGRLILAKFISFLGHIVDTSTKTLTIHFLTSVPMEELN